MLFYLLSLSLANKNVSTIYRPPLVEVTMVNTPYPIRIKKNEKELKLQILVQVVVLRRGEANSQKFSSLSFPACTPRRVLPFAAAKTVLIFVFLISSLSGRNLKHLHADSGQVVFIRVVALPPSYP